MATQVGAPARVGNRWVRPLIPVLGVLVVSVLFLFIGSAIATSRSGDALALTGINTWLPYVLIGGFLAYVLAVAFGDGALWVFGTRQVVYSAVGAALYGVLSWATNVIQ